MTNGNNLDGKLETLIDQVGRLTEGITEIRDLVERVAVTTEQQGERIDRLVETTERQSAVAERQAASIDRLTQIVEGLLNR